MFIQNLVNGITLGSVFALIALGYSMVYGVLFFVNFAHADVMMFGAYFSLILLGSNLPLPIAILCSVTMCAIMGVLIEFLAYRALRGSTRLAAMTSAMGVSIILQVLAQLIWGSGTKSIRSHLDFSVTQLNLPGGITISNLQIITLAVAIVMMLGLTLYLRRTRSGKALRSTALDNEAARLMGINTNHVISMTFAIGSALAAIAGVLLCSAYPSLTPYTGSMPGIKAFVAAVFGGIGSIPGALIGGVLLGVIENLAKAYISSQLSDAIVFSVLIIVLLVRPTGILGKKISEKV